VKLDKETGDILEKAKVKKVTEDACDNEDTENFGEESEERDNNINPESSYDEVNIGEEEAGFEDASEDAFDDASSYDEVDKMTEMDYSQEAGFEDASEDAFDDQDTGDDVIKNISEEEAGFEDAFEDAFDDEDTGEDAIENIS
jgi:hypothetical protein